jgi:mono/diheme cytochrome c family protein
VLEYTYHLKSTSEEIIMKAFYQTITVALGLILALTVVAFVAVGFPSVTLQPVRAFSQSELALPAQAQPTTSPTIQATVVPTVQPTVEAPTDADLIAAGHDLVRQFGCVTCHSANLSGGPAPFARGGAMPANLTPDDETGLGTWEAEDLLRVFREGTRPDGSELSNLMPWQAFGQQMTDDDIEALYAYLQSIPALPYNTR